jgi:hypothetical protein
MALSRMLTCNLPRSLLAGASSFGRKGGIALPDRWYARGSDHFVASDATLTAWAIGLALTDLSQVPRRVGPRPKLSPL